jgi:L-iditol 2-dehydrogenase
MIACPAHSAARLPESASFADGALLEPLGVSVHAVHLARVASGERTAVLGAGVIGLGILQVLHAFGVGPIYVAEPRDERRPLPQALGAARVEPTARSLQEAGARPDVVFEAAGTVEALQGALELVEPGGRVVVVGIPKEEQFVFDAPAPRRKELALIFVRRSRSALPEALRLIEEDRVSFARYPVLQLPLSRADEALRLAAEGMGEYLRIIVNPQET